MDRDRAFPADAGRACAPSGLSRDASQAEPLVPNAAGRSIPCASCGGHGLVLSMCGEPDECSDCGGSGTNWQYPRGAIAKYYSGPLIGRASAIEARSVETNEDLAPSEGRERARTPKGGRPWEERVARDRADWLLDAVATATQDRRFLRGDPEYDEVAGDAILLNGAKAIRTAIAALSPDVSQSEGMVELEAENERLRATISRVRSAIEWVEPVVVTDAELASAAKATSIRKAAAKYGVSVGVVRGAIDRALSNTPEKGESETVEPDDDDPPRRCHDRLTARNC